MKIMNVERAKELAKEVWAAPKECYRNSVLGLYRLKNEEGAEYVEGLLMLSDFGIFIHHGWIETATEILDTTLIGEYQAGQYTGVFRYQMAEVDAKVRRKRMLPFFPEEPEGFRIMGTKELSMWKEIELLYAKIQESNSGRDASPQEESSPAARL